MNVLCDIHVPALITCWTVKCLKKSKEPIPQTYCTFALTAMQSYSESILCVINDDSNLERNTIPADHLSTTHRNEQVITVLAALSFLAEIMFQCFHWTEAYLAPIPINKVSRRQDSKFFKTEIQDKRSSSLLQTQGQKKKYKRPIFSNASSYMRGHTAH